MADNKKYSDIIKAITCIAMNVAIISLCSWMTIPFYVNFTMQTFAIFMISLLFKPKIAVMSVIAYIVIGFLGAPVFSGFQAGLSVLSGSGGGYLLSFIPCTLCVSILSSKFDSKRTVILISAIVGLLLCYIIGTLWFVIVYVQVTSAAQQGIFTAISYCVLPFIIPDTVKIILAFWTSKRILPYKQRTFGEL